MTAPKTKEEILREKRISFGLHQDNTLEEVCDAMDVYAKQVALAFYENEEGVPPEEMEQNFDDFIASNKTPEPITQG